MNKSESIAELAKALNKAQSEMSGAKKGSANPFFKSKYADLAEVINCAKGALSNNGLSVAQFPVTHNGCAGVRTLLMHSSGEYIEDVLLLACTKQDPQAMGSAITYARRYAYQSVLGIPSEDDDGNHASRPAPVTRQQVVLPTLKPSVQNQIPGKITSKQIQRLKTIGANSEKTPEACGVIVNKYGFASSKDITIDFYDRICNEIEAK